MNSSRLRYACPLAAIVLLSSCAIPLTTSQVNRQVCVLQTRSSYETQSKLPFKISNVSVATGGSRVVVEGVVVDPNAPKHGLIALLKEPSAASAASATSAASAAKVATDAVAASATTGAATAVNAASDTVAASAAAASAAAAAVPPGNAGAECLFTGRQLTAFHWLAPVQLAKKAPKKDDAVQ